MWILYIKKEKKEKNCTCVELDTLEYARQNMFYLKERRHD